MTDLGYATVTADLGKLVAASSGPPSSGDLSGQVIVTCDAVVDGCAATLAIPGVGIRAVGPFVTAVAAGGVASVQVPATGQDGVTVPSDFTYTATFDVKDVNGLPVRLPPLTFQAPAGSTVDLSTIAPNLPQQAGTLTPVTLAAVQGLLAEYAAQSQFVSWDGTTLRDSDGDPIPTGGGSSSIAYDTDGVPYVTI